MIAQLSDLLDTVDGDQGLLREVIGVFLEDAPGLVEGVRRALDNGDAAAVYRAAHTLKGSAGNFGVPHIVSSAIRIESDARGNNLPAARDGFEALEIDMAALLIELSALRGNTCES